MPVFQDQPVAAPAPGVPFVKNVRPNDSPVVVKRLDDLPGFDVFEQQWAVRAFQPGRIPPEALVQLHRRGVDTAHAVGVQESEAEEHLAVVAEATLQDVAAGRLVQEQPADRRLIDESSYVVRAEPPDHLEQRCDVQDIEEGDAVRLHNPLGSEVRALRTLPAALPHRAARKVGGEEGLEREVILEGVGLTLQIQQQGEQRHQARDIA